MWFQYAKHVCVNVVLYITFPSALEYILRHLYSNVHTCSIKCLFTVFGD